MVFGGEPVYSVQCTISNLSFNLLNFSVWPKIGHVYMYGLCNMSVCQSEIEPGWFKAYMYNVGGKCPPKP